MARNTALRLADIKHAAEKIARIVKSQDDFLSNDILQDALAYNILAIGEACAALPKELKDSLPNVPWHAIQGLRNRLAHEYFRLDPHILYATAIQNIPELLKQLENWQETQNK